MKKKSLCLIFTSTIIATALVGCNDSNDISNNNNTTTNVTASTGENTTTQNTTTTEENTSVETTTSGSTSENTEPTTVINPSGSITYNFTSFVMGSGFTEQTALDNDTWSSNKTHYINPDSDVMNFSWEGPKGVGIIAYSTSSGTALIMKNPTGEYTLRALTTGETPKETFDATKSWTKEQIVACVHKDVSYIKDGFYNSDISDNTLIYTFAIDAEIDEELHKGYAYFIMTRDTGLCYQFYYLEVEDVYDDERALKVINSIKPINNSDFETEIK